MLRLMPLEEMHLDAVVKLNESAVPAVNSVSGASFLKLRDISECFLTAHLNDSVAGFILLLRPGARYASPNYRWFSRSFADFLYVDRVVVAGTARRRGIGRAFYEEAWRRATQLGAPLTCEVNVRPPNPASMAFHEAFGFVELARQETEDGGKTVSLMARYGA